MDSLEWVRHQMADPQEECPGHDLKCIVNTHPERYPVNEITLDVLDPCVWLYVLNQDDHAQT